MFFSVLRFVYLSLPGLVAGGLFQTSLAAQQVSVREIVVKQGCLGLPETPVVKLMEDASEEKTLHR